MKMRRTKGTKVLATILCQCMILGMISMNVQAATVGNNSEGSTVNEISIGDTMNQNAGTVGINNGTVTTNNGTVTTNAADGTVKNNSSHGTVTTNNGTVENNDASSIVTTNKGAVNNNYGTVTTNAAGGTVTTNKGTVTTNNGIVENNDASSIVTTNAAGGTVTTNKGTVTTNFGTVQTNHEKVTNNCGNVNATTTGSTVKNNYGTIGRNYGTVKNNYGTVEGNCEAGSITNDYREVTISGSNSDKITAEGVNAVPDTAPDNFKQKRYVLIKNSTVSSGTIKLTPIAGYHFVSAPTVSPDCTVTESGTGYSITGITQVISISVDIVADTPNPAPTPSPNDNNDSNEDDKETVPALNPYEIFIQTQIANIENAKADDTVVIESEDCNSYSFNFMKEILNKRDVTVKMIYNYKGEHYEVIIPKNQIFLLDDKIPWYGPLKLAQMFGAVKTPLIK